MSYDRLKNVELYRLRAENCDAEIAPNQRKYNLDVARWLQENDFRSAEEAVEAMRHTPFYEDAALAKTADDIALRIKAMKEVGYDDVARIHEERRQKFLERGNAYAFSPEWIADFREAGKAAEEYARKKELFGRIFSSYFQIAGNPQSQHRREAVQEINTALRELEVMGTNFNELAAEKVYQDLVMATPQGMENFVGFIRMFMIMGHADEDEFQGIAEEQQQLAQWAKANRERLMEVGEKETWHDANCIAVPSEAPGGYDFIAMKEVKE